MRLIRANPRSAAAEGPSPDCHPAHRLTGSPTHRLAGVLLQPSIFESQNPEFCCQAPLLQRFRASRSSLSKYKFVERVRFTPRNLLS